MSSSLPKSLLFFVTAGLVFALQTIPAIGIFLMFVLAIFWSVLLINAGMIGIAIEAASGRVLRPWLIVPVLFYGGYVAIAAQDHLMLRGLSAAYDAANARVTISFDPAHQVLVFENGDYGEWLTQNFALPVAYSVNSNVSEGYRSYRMMGREVCARVRKTPALRASSVYTFGFFDGDAIRNHKMERRFCKLSMPEKPQRPQLRVTRKEEAGYRGLLPVRLVTTTVTAPDGKRYELLGGTASPLSWIPMPVMGCGLNSSNASWDCEAKFLRDRFAPIVSGKARYNRDTLVLARALGLKPVAIKDRKGGDPALVLAKIAAVEETTLERQLANVDAMIADPVAKVKEWQIGAVLTHPEALGPKADAIMTGVERAAAVTGGDRSRARESGRILARLIAYLPRDRFIEFGPRILALYAKADDQNWLWESEALIKRLGDLGVDALPYLIKPRASGRNVNGAAIQGLCRVGSAGRAVSGPMLLAMWERSQAGFDRDRRRDLFVAMRRIGIDPPPLADDQRNQFAQLETEWADISSQSPPRVCATRAEWQARRKEKFSSRRRTNPM